MQQKYRTSISRNYEHDRIKIVKRERQKEYRARIIGTPRCEEIKQEKKHKKMQYFLGEQGKRSFGNHI